MGIISNLFDRFIARIRNNFDLYMGIRTVFYVFYSILLLPFTVILLILEFAFRFRLVRIYDNRIGEFSLGTESKLREMKLKKIRVIGIASDKPCNEQYLKMFERRMKIIRIPHKIYMNFFFQALSSSTPMGFLKLYYVISTAELFQKDENGDNDYARYFRKTGCAISFTEKEKREGNRLLSEMGVRGWYICFHSRDAAYVSGICGREREKNSDFRNSSIENYMPAIEHIAKKGGYALRMGAKVQKPLPEKRDKKIIDYASEYRSDFGDIYLTANCRFFVGSSTGILQVAQCFDVPVVFTNSIVLHTPPFNDKDLFIMKKIYSRKKKRFLSIRELLEMNYIRYCTTYSFYEKEKLDVIENTPEEVTDVTMEMYERLEGTWKGLPGDDELQQRFRERFKGIGCDNYKSRVGAKFLRENKWLLD